MELSKRLLLALLTTLIGVAQASAAEMMTEEMDLRRETREWGRSLRARNQFQLDGSIELIGQSSPAQIFSRGKLIPCTIQRDLVQNVVVATRKSCDDSKRIYVPLTDGVTQPATPVPPGLYLLGYENSIYPGYVVISPGQSQRIVLQRIPVPPGGTVKIYRNLNSLVEQQKIYFTTYTTGKSFFKLGEYAFGDLYVQKVGNTNAPPSLSYDFCEQPALPELTARGQRICRAWNQGSFMGVMEMFDFRTDSRFVQWEVRKPGKPYGYRFARLLVAKATTSTRASFVNVLPGSYSVEVTGTNGKANVLPPVTVGPLYPETSTLVTSFGLLPSPETLALNGPAKPRPVLAVDPVNDPLIAQPAGLSPEGDEPALTPGETCSSAILWRTESRAYCKIDLQEGCDRASARLCEPMVVDLQ